MHHPQSKTTYATAKMPPETLGGYREMAKKFDATILEMMVAGRLILDSTPPERVIAALRVFREAGVQVAS